MRHWTIAIGCAAGFGGYRTDMAQAAVAHLPAVRAQT
jgi:hypothetical protein